MWQAWGGTSWSTSLWPAPPSHSTTHVPTPTPFHPLAPSNVKLTAVEGDPRSGPSAFISEGPEREYTYHGKGTGSSPPDAPFVSLHSPSLAPAVVHVASTSRRPRTARLLCIQHCEGSNLGFRELSLPNAEVSEWLSSLNTVHSVKRQRGLMAHLDIGWEVGDLSEFLAILNAFFLPKAWVDVSVMLLNAPSLLSCWCVHGWCECLCFGEVGRW